MFTFPVRIYWEDTDAGGIVFYANYLKFMERARTEWLRSLGISQQALKQQTGGMFVVTDTKLKYLLPARLDDVLQVSTQIVEKGRASLTISQEIRLFPLQNVHGLLSNQDSPYSDMNSASAKVSDNHDASALLCQGTICIAWVDCVTLKPGRMPASISEVLH